MTGKQLKGILYTTGLQQIELAEKMGMSQQNFNKSLMVQDVKTGFLEKLCEVLNVKMSFFYRRSKRKKRSAGITRHSKTLKTYHYGLFGAKVKKIFDIPTMLCIF